MQPIAFKMLFRKKGTASAIIVIALLVALLASVNALVNNINSQTTLVTKLAGTGNAYLLTDEKSTSLLESKLSPNTINTLKDNPQISYATAQMIIQATLTTNTGDYQVTIKGIDDIQTYLKNNKASINGTISKENQANIGIILSKLASINKNDLLNLTINGRQTQLKVTSITQANQQTDTQITMPLSTLQTLTQNTNQISHIEFTIKDTNQANTILNNLTQTLPANTKITSLQQITTFAGDINNQTATFITVWSIAIYMVVAGASYIVVARIINESQHDLYILRTIGSKKSATFSLILIYALTLAFLGALIGFSLGLVGTQTISTFIRWQYGNAFLAPSLEVTQVLQLLLLTITAALIGSVYPAIKAVQTITRVDHQ
jgi:ABC-type lipoprotein release transport system permease subunit